MMSKFKYNESMTATDIDKGTKSIGTRVKSMRSNMNSIAVSILHNWAKSGAVNVAVAQAVALLKAGDDAHAQKIVNWFVIYGGWTFDEKEEAFVYDSDKTTLTAAEYQECRKETMFELTPDNPPKAFDLLSQVTKLVARAEAKCKKGLSGDDKVPTDVLAALKAIV